MVNAASAGVAKDRHTLCLLTWRCVCQGHSQITGCIPSNFIRSGLVAAAQLWCSSVLAALAPSNDGRQEGLRRIGRLGASFGPATSVQGGWNTTEK